MTVVDKIFELMKQNNLNAKQFSSKVGISQGNITDWKKGRSKPSVSALNKIANEFNVSIDYLLGNEEIPSYSEILTSRLKPLNLSKKQFELFKEMAFSYIDNPNNAETIANKLKDNNLKKDDLNKILGALDIFSGIANEFEKDTKFNKITLFLKMFEETSHDTNNLESVVNNTNINDTTNSVRNGLIDALNNLDESYIINEPSIDTPEIRAIARDVAKLNPEKKELFKNLLKQMSDEANEANKK